VTTAHLFSGGLDSLCLWYLTGRHPTFYVRIGAPYEPYELKTIEKLSALIPGLEPIILEGPELGPLEAPDGHIPHRNLLLAATVAAHNPDADKILLGALRGEASPDKSVRFLRAASKALSASEGRSVRLVAPGRYLTKTALVRLFAKRFPGELDLLGETRSCYARTNGPCEKCNACFRRRVALWHAGLGGARPVVPADPLQRGVRAALVAGPHRWPALAVNNLQAAAAVAGVRWPGA
jgi:7-cyano-7-deazaguanine synthase in queuosine biosynthesis